jgi:hypothetical protein
MHIRFRRWLPATLLLGTLFLTGCGVGEFLYFVLPESKQPPLCAPIASKEKKKVKAMVLVYAQGVDNRRDAMQVDRDLAELLVKNMREQFESNQEKVDLIPPRQIEDFKSHHPDWKDSQPFAIGKLLGVDYVIVLEINSFTLHADGRQMFRGQTSIAISLVDVHKGDEAPEHKEFTCRYPNDSKGAVDKDLDMPESKFRLEFLENVAKRLMRYFVAYEESKTRDID